MIISLARKNVTAILTEYKIILVTIYYYNLSLYFKLYYNHYEKRNTRRKINRVVKESVSVIPYDQRWPSMFQEEKQYLPDVLQAGFIKRIEHFGSTAVPGLAAKPIIDILIEVTSLDEVRREIPPILEPCGYEYGFLYKKRIKMRIKTLLSWSSGKDSAWALHLLRKNPATDLVGLFTVINRKYGRVSMHSTRLELLRRQADAAGLPIQLINLPDPCTNDDYDTIMRKFVTDCISKGIKRIAFGDLFLENIRRYREKQLDGTGIEPFFPLWGIPTDKLAEKMLTEGIEAYVSCVDLNKLPASCAGRKWSRELLDEFPEGIDPCGENGEIHTVVAGGPMFEKIIPVKIGKTVERNGFVYIDIIPTG